MSVSLVFLHLRSMCPLPQNLILIISICQIFWRSSFLNTSEQIVSLHNAKLYKKIPVFLSQLMISRSIAEELSGPLTLTKRQLYILNDFFKKRKQIYFLCEHLHWKQLTTLVCLTCRLSPELGYSTGIILYFETSKNADHDCDYICSKQKWTIVDQKSIYLFYMKLAEIWVVADVPELHNRVMHWSSLLK